MINAAFVRECKPRAKMYEVTCDALPGFILRVLPTGKKVALVRYRVAGKDHRAKLGCSGPTLSIDEARRQAASCSQALPSARASPSDRARRRGHAPSTGTARTGPVSDHHAAIARRALHRGCTSTCRLKPGTAERYRQADVILPYEILPKPLGDRDFRSIKRPTIKELHAGMKGRPGAANNMVVVISSLYTCIIEDWEL
jgi:hypothetical protein